MENSEFAVLMLLSRRRIPLLLLMLLTSCSARSTYYVTPIPDTPCPGEPCHTLSEYVAGQYFNNLPVNTTMEFLPGSHTLEQTISVINLTWLTLHGDSSSLPEVTSRIECTWPAGFVFTNITELYISALTYTSCGHHNSAAVQIISVKLSNISQCTFYNSVNADSNGGALYIQNSYVILAVNKFQHNTAAVGGALIVESSALNLTRNTFHSNSAEYGGAAFCVWDSTLHLIGNTFQNSVHGGAFIIRYSNLSLTGNAFQNNSAINDGGVLYVEHSTLNLTGNTFQNNSGDYGGVLYLDKSTLSLTGNTFQYNSASRRGGTLYVKNSNLSLTGNVFQNNSADHVAGTIYADESNLHLIGNIFQNNSAHYGGALHIDKGTLSLTGNTFQYNSADYNGGALHVQKIALNLTENTFQYNSADNGGALYVQDSTLNLTGNIFRYSSADSDGGVLYVRNNTLSLTENTFQYNSVDNDGGALYVWYSTLNFTGNTFQNNSAVNSGGTLHVLYSTLHFVGNIFQKSYATFGGTLHMSISNMIFTDDSFTDSYAHRLGGSIATGHSIVKMYNITIGNNRAEYGGGMAAVDSQLEVSENTFFENNRASYGGGLYEHNTEFKGNAVFTNNSVTEGGGAIYASNSTFHLMDNTMIISNSAMDGGGLLISGDSQLFFRRGVIHFISNSARSTGGAIKVKESNILTYCIPSMAETFDLISSDCFFQIVRKRHHLYNYISDFPDLIDRFNINHTLRCDNNSAVEAGTDLYGGSVDSCTLNIYSQLYDSTDLSGHLFDVITSNENKPAISSDPLHICTCRDGLTNCTGSYHPEPVYPGGTLEVPVIALGQRNGMTTAVIQVTDTSNITLSSLEYSQKIDNTCNTLKYTIHSRAVGTTQAMTLYAQGPCLPSQSNTLTVTVSIQHCPPGFQLSKKQPICIYAERLQQFTNTCLVDSTSVLCEHNTEFWVGYDRDNESRGLILHPNCPFDYCTSEETYLAVDDSDKQCNYNRSGLLCGRCSENLSLALGSSRCLQCSNSYLSLLAAFAFAGIALVLLLLVLRLTVAAGTINGLVFYANIVAVNSAIFFQPQIKIPNVPTGLIANVLRVFIAWPNLDLGIETCFYNGMDAYVKTWMQFAFPLYVWTLVGMIIVGSYYSGRVASIFGRNPIAVLATLFLLSYAKLLHTCSFCGTFIHIPRIP